jgi:ABC-type polar amino acid transport system ATPase subunit
MIQFERVVHSYDAQRTLDQVDLKVSRGERIALLGPSGSGKSTLLRCINRLEVTDSGRITVFGRDLSAPNLKVRELRADVGMVFQQFNLFPHMTVLDNVCLAPMRVRGASRQEAEREARRLLGRVGMGHKADSYPSQLSGGQQQRVAIARSLAMRPTLMLFDEPTSALDPEMVHEVLSVINDIAAEGMTILIATHEMEFARRVSNRILFMDLGRIVEDSDPASFFREPRTERARTFLAHLSRSRAQTEQLIGTGTIGPLGETVDDVDLRTAG